MGTPASLSAGRYPYHTFPFLRRHCDVETPGGEVGKHRRIETSRQDASMTIQTCHSRYSTSTDNLTALQAFELDLIRGHWKIQHVIIESTVEATRTRRTDRRQRCEHDQPKRNRMHYESDIDLSRTLATVHQTSSTRTDTNAGEARTGKKRQETQGR